MTKVEISHEDIIGDLHNLFNLFWDSSKGVKLTKKAMAAYEKVIKRMPGLENYFVEIKPSPA